MALERAVSLEGKGFGILFLSEGRAESTHDLDHRFAVGNRDDLVAQRLEHGFQGRCFGHAYTLQTVARGLHERFAVSLWCPAVRARKKPAKSCQFLGGLRRENQRKTTLRRVEQPCPPGGAGPGRV